MKKIFFILICFLFVFFNTIYAGSVLKSQTNYYEYTIDFSDSTTIIEDSNVIFTQDDYYYYFDITQKLKNEKYNSFARQHATYNDNGTSVSVRNKTYFALAPFSNINSIVYYEYTRPSSGTNKNIKLNGNQIAYYNTADKNGSFHTYDTYIMERFGSVDYNLQGAYNGYVQILSSSNVWEAVANGCQNFTSKIKLKILKSRIDTYRYFRFTQPLYWQALDKSDANYTYEHRSGITNYSLDLKNISECEHIWEYGETVDENKHTKICEKCKWEKMENHNFQYEYDGMLDNLCECGLNKYVNVIYDIKDDYSDVIVKQVNSNSNIEQIGVNSKTGFDFLYYKKYEKRFVDSDYSEDNTKINEVFVENVYQIDLDIKNLSVRYEAVYKPYNYYIKYNNVNNYNIEFDESLIHTQTLEYGKNEILDKNVYVKDYYSFLGWAVRPNLDTPIYSDEDEVINLTTIKDDIINVFPVFAPFKYDVYYVYNEDENYKIKKSYIINEEENLIDFEYNLPNDKQFVGWEIFNDTLKNATTKHLEQYINMDNQILILKAKVIDNKTNSNKDDANDETNSKDDNSSNSSSNNNTSNGSNSNTGSKNYSSGTNSSSSGNSDGSYYNSSTNSGQNNKSNIINTLNNTIGNNLNNNLNSNANNNANNNTNNNTNNNSNNNYLNTQNIDTNDLNNNSNKNSSSNDKYEKFKKEEYLNSLKNNFNDNINDLKNTTLALKNMSSNINLLNLDENYINENNTINGMYNNYVSNDYGLSSNSISSFSFISNYISSRSYLKSISTDSNIYKQNNYNNKIINDSFFDKKNNNINNNFFVMMFYNLPIILFTSIIVIVLLLIIKNTYIKFKKLVKS